MDLRSSSQVTYTPELKIPNFARKFQFVKKRIGTFVNCQYLGNSKLKLSHIIERFEDKKPLEHGARESNCNIALANIFCNAI